MAQKSPPRFKLLDAVKHEISQSTQRDTEFIDITRSSQVLRKASVEVFPQLEEIDFYGGYRSPEFGYVPLSARARKATQERVEYMKIVELPEVLQEFKSGHITFVGPAGSGKTTLLKAIARDVMIGKYACLKEIEFVHFLQGRNLYMDQEISPMELLLHNLERELSNEELLEYASFIKQHPDKILIIIDSLDTLPYDLAEEKRRIRMKDRATPGAILWNILTGNIFAGCRVITSSREHTIRKYVGKLRAKKIIALAGLTKESIKHIVTAYLGLEEAEKTMQYLETKSRSLLYLCSTPVFLALTLTGLHSKPGFSPKTMTGVLVVVLRGLLSTRHIHQENIFEVIERLQEMAFYGTKQGRVVFYAHELELFGLKEDDVTDLVISAPGQRSQKLLLHENVFFFCHQSLQEAMAAFHVAQMKAAEFARFVNNEIHKAHYAVIRRILCGIVFDEGIKSDCNELMAGEVYPEHRVIFFISLKQLLNEAKDETLLELLVSISEAGESGKHITGSILPPLRFGANASALPFLPSEIQAVGTIVSQCDRATEVSFVNCGLDAFLLGILNRTLIGTSVLIGKLNVPCNKTMEVEGVTYVGEIVTRCCVRALDVSLCDLSDDQLLALKDAVHGTQIENLNIYGNENLGPDGFAHLGEIVNRCGVRDLNLDTCDVSPKKIEAFNKAVGDAKIDKINLSLNIDLGTEGFFHLGKLADRCKLRHLDVSWCGLEKDALVTFSQAVGHAKLESLTVDMNADIDVEGYVELGKIAKHCSVQQINMRDCDLSAEKMAAFAQGVENSKVTCLDVSNNRDLGILGLEELGSVIQKCEINCVTMAAMQLTAKEIEAFLRGIGPAKIEKLDLSKYYKETASWTSWRKESLRLEDAEEVHKFFPWVTEVLDIKGCGVDEAFLQGELDALFPTKLKVVIGEAEESVSLSSTDRSEGNKQHAGRHAYKSTENMVSSLSFHKGASEPRIVAAQTCSKVLGALGGEIQTGDCTITFPGDAFQEETRVDVKIEIDKTKWPSGYIAITPMLFVEPANAPRVPVKVHMKTCWLVSDGSDESKSTEVEALHLSSATGEWEVVRSFPLDGDTGFQFETTDFSPFLVGLKEWLFGPQYFLVDGSLFANGEDEFMFAFFLKCSVAIEAFNAKWAPRGYNEIVEFNTLRSKRGENVRISVKSLTDGFDLEPGEHRFPTDYVIDVKQLTFNSIVEANEGHDADRVRIKCDIYKDDEVVDKNRHFYYKRKRQEKGEVLPTSRTMKEATSSGAPQITINISQTTTAGIIATNNSTVTSLSKDSVSIVGGLPVDKS